MVAPPLRVLVIPDGASEPVRSGTATALEQARTPTLDDLCARGAVRRVATTLPGQDPGSETGIPALLGVPATGRISRGRLEAASAGIHVAAGHRAWRIDLRHPDGTRACEARTRAALALLDAALDDHAVHHLRGHRGLAIGREAPVVDMPVDELDTVVWGDGDALAPTLGRETLVISGPGAARGCARSLGATHVQPPGATGGPDADLSAKARAALEALHSGIARIVVHVGAPDEAAHAGDFQGKVDALERVDAEILAPLWDHVRVRGGRLAVCPDHGTDPRTGTHDGAPVPAVCAGPGIRPDGRPVRMTERTAADRPVVDARWAGASA